MGRDQRNSASRTVQLAEDCVTAANEATRRADEAHARLENLDGDLREVIRREVLGLIDEDRRVEMRLVAIERSYQRFLRMTFFERARHALTGWLPPPPVPVVVVGGENQSAV